MQQRYLKMIPAEILKSMNKLKNIIKIIFPLELILQAHTEHCKEEVDFLNISIVYRHKRQMTLA